MDGCHSLAHTHPIYWNVVWESDQSAGTSAHAHLHYQHVSSVHALSSKVTHVANQPRLATPCLPHDDNSSVELRAMTALEASTQTKVTQLNVTLQWMTKLSP